MNNMIVLIDDWQMQCCGMPFKTGDYIEWTVVKKEEVNEVWDKFYPEPIEYYYENHADAQMKIPVLKGIVGNIYANFFRYEIELRRQHKFQKYKEYFIPVEMKSIIVGEADGWHNDMDTNVWKFGCYTVYLQNPILNCYESN